MEGGEKMVKDVRELSTEKLKKRIRAAIIILSICWGAVIIFMLVALIFGNSASVGAGAAGLGGLIVASIAMMIGIKKAKEEISRRHKSADNS